MEIPFGVTRYPPQLPNNEDPSLHRNTAWKLTPEGFVGRPLLPTDTNRTTYDDTDDSPLLRLGTPHLCPTPATQYWNNITERWGLQVLNAAGFVNARVPEELTQQSWLPGGVLGQLHADDTLHPVLRRDM